MAVASRHRRGRKLPDIESPRGPPNAGPGGPECAGARGDERVTCSNVNTVVCIAIAALPSACQRRGWPDKASSAQEETASPPHKDRARSPECDRPPRTT
ncbi:hypothetical protein HPB50_017207 [Hyalomma asiaticum]|uniref:Uncharacterized protein n=1 Tax=Hyalomma asiaticum TaxID=266040 RepID=A0ACB7S7T3_HYAAI|nr:hypothetical protein HPB50_017207 [Hyalomma asiaticum]